MATADRILKLSPLRIIGIYLLIGVSWILLTDSLIQRFVTDLDTLSLIQTYKGWLFVSLSAIVFYFLISLHDRELKRTQRESSVKSELFQKLFDRIPAMITLYNPRLEQFTVNNAFVETLGYTNEDVAEMDLLERAYPDPKIREEATKHMSSPGKEWKEFSVTAKDGKEVISSWSNIRLSNDFQLGIGLDLTEVKQKETEITESKRLLAKILNSLKECVILVEPETRVIKDCNQATIDLFGYSREELIGSTTRILHLDDDHFRRFDELGEDGLESDNFFQTEYALKRKNGDVFDSDQTVTFVRDEQGRTEAAVSVVRDISSQKQYERRLEASLREKETLLQEVHHRVKNNLALVVSFLWLQKDKIADDEISKIFADNILRIKSIALIHEILYKSEKLSQINLANYYEDLMETIETTRGPDSDIDISHECDEIYLNVNQALPSALIVNELISNSLQHAFPNGSPKNKTINLKIWTADKKITLKIEDNGTGLPAEFCEDDYSLGYSIIHTLFRQLNADYDIKTDNGTCVTFSFDRKEVAGSASSII